MNTRALPAIALLVNLALQPLALASEAPPPAFDTAALPVIDEVDLGSDTPGHRIQFYPEPGVAQRTNILGVACLTLPNPPLAPDRFVAVRLGEGKGLQAGVPYVLQIDYPEDAARSMIVWNTGNETTRGFHTGSTVGDALKMPFVFGNPESLDYPLSHRWQRWTSVFELHPRFSPLQRSDNRPLVPSNGFTVVVAHYRHENDPTSAGVALGHIRLMALPDRSALTLPLIRPPASLPQRHLFWREEMSDGVLADKGTPAPAFTPEHRVEWYAAKMRLMKFLGLDTFSRDLLEFGHNQGWDSSKFGGNDWIYQTPYPGLWSEVVAQAGSNGLSVLPMYEYCGSIGGHKALGVQRRCQTLTQAHKGPNGQDNYTHIWWSEKANVDVTDPDSVEDLRRILEITIADERSKAEFLGAWIRPRSAAMPVSFSDRCLSLFARETRRPAAPTRLQLRHEAALYRDYLTWWHLKRREYLGALRDYLRQPSVLGTNAVVLFTGDPTEPGRVLDGDRLVTDTPALFPGMKTILPQEVVERHLGWAALTGEHPTWGGWEWQHAVPSLDPGNYTAAHGLFPTMAFNRQFSVSDRSALRGFTTADGLAMIRHYPLNENCFGDKATQPLGYFVADFEEAGPYCVLAEARALAWGDPRFIGYLMANSFQRGFPDYVRAFNRAFLALPALPSHLLENASSQPEVVVREIPAAREGTWYAIVNTGMAMAREVSLTLAATDLRDVLTGTPVTKRVLTLYPGQVLVWHTPPPPALLAR